MEVKRVGRFTSHEVRLGVEEAKPFSNSITEGEIHICGIVITYQYLWSDGEWHVLHVTAYGTRVPERAGTDGAKVLMRDPANWPSWVHQHVLSNTPAKLADPEMIK